MRRSSRPRSVGFKSWFLGILIAGGALVALFSLKAPELLPKEWPLGIRPEEVQFYAKWLDRRPVDVANKEVTVFELTDGNGSNESALGCLEPGWKVHVLRVDDRADTVRIRRSMDRAGYEMEFNKRGGYQGQRRLELTAAGPADIAAKYLEWLATDRGLITPAVSFVRIMDHGSDEGPYRVEESVDKDLLERRGRTNTLLVTMGMDPTRPDQQFAAMKGGRKMRDRVRGILEQAVIQASTGNTDALAALVNEDAAADWLLMAILDGRELGAEEVPMAYSWSSGLLEPIYRAPQREWPFHQADSAPLAFNMLTPLLQRPAFVQLFEGKLDSLRSRIPEFEARFTELDTEWLPVLGDPAALPFSKTTALQVRHKLLVRRLSAENLLDQLVRPLAFGPGHKTLMHGMPIPEAAPVVDDQRGAMDALAARLHLVQKGDSLIFNRGKYTIDEDLIFPAGTSVILQQGARLFMGAGKSIVCYGDLHIRGTLRNPVFIRAEEDAPFGTLALSGDGSQRCSISGLMISGGVGAEVNGVQHSGMVSLHGAAEVVMGPSILGARTAAEALHIDGGRISIDGLRFEPGEGTQLRSDRVQGSVSSCTFRTGPEGSKAPAFLVSASKVAITGSSFTGAYDRVMDVRSASEVLVLKNRFTKGNIAIAAEDLSVVHVEGNTFVSNEIVLKARKVRTKRGAILLVYTNELMDNGKEEDVDDGSTLENLGAFDPKVLSLFGLDPGVLQSEGGRRTGRRQ